MEASSRASGVTKSEQTCLGGELPARQIDADSVRQWAFARPWSVSRADRPVLALPGVHDGLRWTVGSAAAQDG